MSPLIEPNPPVLILCGFLIASFGWLFGAGWKAVCIKNAERRIWREAETFWRARAEQDRRDAEPAPPLPRAYLHLVEDRPVIPQPKPGRRR